MIKYTGKTHKRKRENYQLHCQNTSTRTRKLSNTLVKLTNANAEMIKYTGKTHQGEYENDQMHW